MDHHQFSDSWERGDPYERYIGRWSRKIAPLFVAWLRNAGGERWLDVGCGTGALCTAIAEHGAPLMVAGLEPSQGFLQAAKGNLAGRAAFCQGTATRIPLDAASIDVVVSGLVLNFLADPDAALREMVRVVTEGGVIAAYVWDYGGRMDMLRLFWDTAAELDPDAARMVEGVRFPICNPAPLTELFAQAGLRGIDVTAIDITTPFTSFDDYWQPFLGGQGPAPAYVMKLNHAARASLRDRLRERISTQEDGAISLIARAWAVRGRAAA